MRMGMKRFLTIILSCIACIALHAQDAGTDIKDDWAIWQYTTVTKSFDNGIGMLLRLEHRSKNHAQDLDCALVMPGVFYKATPWLQLGFIYDYAVTSTKNRHVLLPYATATHKAGDFTFTGREMLQYIISTDNLLFRTKLQVQYKIQGTHFSPYIAIEPYSNSKYSKENENDNFLVGVADWMGVARSSNFFGTNIVLGKKSVLDVAYSYYYLGSSAPARHLLVLGYTYRL